MVSGATTVGITHTTLLASIADFDCCTLSPGRFFAANEMKCMLAHLVMEYDIQNETPGQIPPPFQFNISTIPNGTAKVLFRKRRLD